MAITGNSSSHLKSVFKLFGIFVLSTVKCCTSNSYQYKKIGESVTLQFQAVTISSENAALPVANMILFKNGQLLSVAYTNNTHIITSKCHGCSFIGNASIGELAIRIDNLQTPASGTYKHIVDQRSNVLGCVTIYILGVPSKPNITINRSPLVGKSVTLTCSSNSTTTPSNNNLSLLFIWRVDGQSNPSGSRYSYSADMKTLTISNVVKEDANKSITCTATEDVVDGYTSSSSNQIFLNVLYPPDGPPEIQGISNGGTYKVLDKTKALLSCVVMGGNPLATLSWNCYNDGAPSEIHGTIVTKNVTWSASRDQERTCICQSNHAIAGKQTASVFVQILYPPSVISFFVKGSEGNDHAILDEHDDFQLICTVDSKPESVVRLIFEGELLQEVPETNTLTSTHTAVCLGAGNYTCEGTNGIGEPSNMTLMLNVRCSPRPLHQIKENFTSPTKLPVTLSLKVLAYPEPGRSGYKWHKHDGTRWTPLLSNADLLISSSGLQSNLRILNVSKSDFGQYRLTIVNSLGKYEQYLFLKEIQDFTSSASFPTLSETINDIGHDDTQTDNTTVIVGVVLSILCLAVVVYATVVTVLLKRKTSKKESETPNESVTQTTYVNLGFESNVSDDQNTVKTGHEKSDVVDRERQYTSLDPFTKNDNAAYDVIQTH